MAEGKRKAPAKSSKGKQPNAAQNTLLQHFMKKPQERNHPSSGDDEDKAPIEQKEAGDPGSSCTSLTDALPSNEEMPSPVDDVFDLDTLSSLTPGSTELSEVDWDVKDEVEKAVAMEVDSELLSTVPLRLTRAPSEEPVLDYSLFEEKSPAASALTSEDGIIDISDSSYVPNLLEPSSIPLAGSTPDRLAEPIEIGSSSPFPETPACETRNGQPKKVYAIFEKKRGPVCPPSPETQEVIEEMKDTAFNGSPPSAPSPLQVVGSCTATSEGKPARTTLKPNQAPTQSTSKVFPLFEKRSTAASSSISMPTVDDASQIPAESSIPDLSTSAPLGPPHKSKSKGKPKDKSGTAPLCEPGVNASQPLSRGTRSSTRLAAKSSSKINAPVISPPITPRAMSPIDQNIASTSRHAPKIGGSRDEPIVIPSSPTKSPSSEPPKAFFQAKSPRPSPKPRLKAEKETEKFTLFVSGTSTLGSRPEGQERRKSRLWQSDHVFQTPLPSNENQHVRGPQTSYTAGDAPFPRRNEGKHKLSTDEITLTLSEILKLDVNALRDESRHVATAGKTTTPSDVDVQAYLSTIPYSHRLVPAISRALTGLESCTSTVPSKSSEGQLWTDKYRPRRAEEVLGNEDNAVYLRSWLRALALQTDTGIPAQDASSDTSSTRKRKAKGKKEKAEKKRPRIVRAVDKSARGRRAGSDDEDDWIVDSDEEEEEEVSSEQEDEDELDFCQATLRRLQRATGLDVTEDAASASSSQERTPSQSESRGAPSGPSQLQQLQSRPDIQFNATLTNTILLTGPPGSGKTASVYACAEELGWDVFEVYPGIGKRTGAMLESLVGDVARNHVLGDMGGGKKPAAPLQERNDSLNGLFAKRRRIEDPEDEDDELLLKSNQNQQVSPDGSMNIRQSLVLLEEVDILYKDDANFWPSVINLIKDCRRPVVLTCNAVSLIPTQELPLQNISTFSPAPPDVAISYLQSICAAERMFVKRDQLLRMYKHNTHPLTSADVFDGSQHSANNVLPVPDLRRTIYGLQFNGPADGCETTTADSGSQLQWMDRVADWTRCSFDGSEDSRDHSDNTGSWAEITSLRRHTDLVSFADSNLYRDPLEVYAWDARPSGNDEYGHRSIHMGVDPSVSKLKASAFYNHDQAMLEETIRLSRAGLPGHGTSRHDDDLDDDLRHAAQEAYETPKKLLARVVHRTRLVAVLRSLIPVTSLVRRRACLDYEPWIRYMVSVDDEEERRAQAASASQSVRQGRPTRNSQKSYVRYITLFPEQERMVRESGFEFRLGGDASTGG